MMKRKGVIASIIFIAVFIGIAVFRNAGNTQQNIYQKNEGMIFGTLYHIIYEYPQDLHNPIHNEFEKFNLSLSTFKPESTISRINLNDSTVILDPWFLNVFNRSLDISARTDSAFDMTVAPLVNAWGFGFKKMENVTPARIDSIREFVGIEKIRISNGQIIKDDPRIMLDAAAIAKGYACDVIAQLLEKNGINNYMVEIGGELNVKGLNPAGKAWRIAINKPIEDQSADAGEIQDIISITDGGMATSGNYRNFYYKDGKRYAHTIDPRTGYPVEHSLLSSTVIAPDCMTADAYATAFMVLGQEKALQIVEADAELEAYFIYAVDSLQTKTIASSGFRKYLHSKD